MAKRGNPNFVKGNKITRKGSPNKDTLLKRAIIAAVKANDLAKWKKEHFNDFMKAVISLLPKTDENKLTGNITIKIETVKYE